jgi:hypothetical protein
MPMSERADRPLDRIAPDDLPEQVDGAETVDDAVEYLHKHGSSSTPVEQRPRCPGCGTVRIAPLPGFDDVKEYGADYRCDRGHRFDAPAPPAAEVDDDFDLADLDGFEGADDGEDDDPFEWVDADDLAEPPISRQLKQLDDRTLTALAIYCYAPWEDGGPSYRELSFVFPYSRQWIGERVRAWRDGEFRDLVADPRPWRVDE